MTSARPASSFLLLAIVLPVLLAPAGPVRAQDEVRLHLVAHGALEADAVAAHGLDRAHFCSAAADPWAAPDIPDERPTPFPFYRLVFGQAGPEDEPARPGPSLGVTLSNYFAAAREHSDPINDSIELVLAGRHFVGHADMRDPGYRFAVTYREDRRGGGFVARHLHEDGTGDGVLDVEGNWECPAVAADLPEREITVHRLFSGATPAHAEPSLYRVTRSDIPCLDRGCAAWRVTDEDSGNAYLARVDFRRLRLARNLRRLAQAGIVDLLVAGEVHRGNPPRLEPRQLQGVVPNPLAAPSAITSASAEPAAPAHPTPQTRLR
jgi:hypothetical protein